MRPPAALALALTIALPAHAQDRRAEARALLETALAEQRLALTCSSLTPRNHDVLVEAWRTDVARALPHLARIGLPADEVLAFRAAAAPEALLPAPETPFADVTALCDANRDWEYAFFEFRHTILDIALPRLLAQ